MFLEVARRSPWCRGTPAHVHWSLLRVLSSASLRFRSRLNGMAGDVSLSTGLRFSSCSPVRDRPPPPRICDFPTSGNSTTFPLIPAAPSGHVVGAEMLSPISCLLFPAPAAYDTATTIAVFSSDSLPPPTATIPPVSPRRAILSLRFTRDLSAFINYIATERCVSLLPVCLAAATAIV